ncbi:MAG: outer-membrane lipoprotein LolB [marine bacterium B5-7]|nr:MAG: outer-membrane lipoprotein LolB [marine bacterium B5-7]
MTVRIALVCMATFWLSACATVTPITGQLSGEVLTRWQQRTQRLEVVDQWDIKGRMGVRTADDGGSATFVWERTGQTHRIEMFGPFGSGRITIEQTPSGATLTDGDAPPVLADSAEELLYYKVGWHVPFQSLESWLKGIPSPIVPYHSLEVDTEGRASGFTQDGWEVSIVDYDKGDLLDLPHRVFIHALPGTVHLVGESGEDLGDRLDVRVVLKRWQITNETPRT